LVEISLYNMKSNNLSTGKLKTSKFRLYSGCDIKITKHEKQLKFV